MTYQEAQSQLNSLIDNPNYKTAESTGTRSKGGGSFPKTIGKK